MKTAKTKTAPIFLRTSFTEVLTFTGGKPSAQTRRALREAGFRWNGLQWFRNQNQTAPIKAKDLEGLLVPAPAEEPQAATA